MIAAKAHWQIVSPPTLTGRSGVTHRFDFVATAGQERLVFDIFERLSETDVIKTYVKKLDTGASAYIIYNAKSMTEGTGRLVSEYDLKVLHSDNIESTFMTKRMEHQPRSRRLTAAPERERP